ncbi:metallophosphoesterase family protein [Tunturiibacter gelidoferens]|uniref:Metallophosphoesterase n=1 Tax=Tunturiibacter gelidiferens TaxID=3069689 RepID=A0AAU7YZG8_9BACT
MGRHRPTLDDGWWCAHLEVIGAGDEGRRPKSPQVGRFPFVQISDSHIGFNKGANPNVTGTLTKAIDRVNVVPAWMKAPDFMIHTGDITQNSKAAEFDTAAQVIKSAQADEVFYVPASMTSSTMANSTSSVSARYPSQWLVYPSRSRKYRNGQPGDRNE